MLNLRRTRTREQKMATPTTLKWSWSHHSGCVGMDV